jgi:hypothetical protein
MSLNCKKKSAGSGMRTIIIWLGTALGNVLIHLAIYDTTLCFSWQGRAVSPDGDARTRCYG